MKTILLTAGLWILWCITHSVMISLTVTGYLKHKLGERFRFYRLVFNTVSIVTLAPILIYGHYMHEQAMFRWERPLIVFQIFLLTIGFLLLLAGARHYDMFQFLGLRQIGTSSSHCALTESGKLDTTGILSKTRHPWYLAAILLIWSRGFDISIVFTNIVLTIYLSVGTILEERKLLIEYGQEYRDYQKNVSMLFPFKWFLTKKRPDSP